MTAAKAANGTNARALAPAQLDVAQSPISAQILATLFADLIARHLPNADTSGLGLMHDAVKRAATRHIGQLRRLHPEPVADDDGAGE